MTLSNKIIVAILAMCLTCTAFAAPEAVKQEIEIRQNLIESLSKNRQEYEVVLKNSEFAEKIGDGLFHFGVGLLLVAIFKTKNHELIIEELGVASILATARVGFNDFFKGYPLAIAKLMVGEGLSGKDKSILNAIKNNVESSKVSLLKHENVLLEVALEEVKLKVDEQINEKFPMMGVRANMSPNHRQIHIKLQMTLISFEIKFQQKIIENLGKISELSNDLN